VGKAARLGDKSDHGGFIITASPDVLINDKGVAREGDLHQCPRPGHGIKPLNSGLSPNINANDKAVAVQGMTRAACGALIIEGSDDVSDNS
jgi:uncharacterized Zn-binding protein involved in type VI secretion